jgi:hypothetical protein
MNALSPRGRPVIGTLEGRRLLSVAYAGAQLAAAPAAVPPPRPTIKSLSIKPASASRGVTLTLVANAVAAPPGMTIAGVDFYRDANGNGRFDKAADGWVGADRSPAHGYRASFATAGRPAGKYVFFARARDSAGNAGKVRAASATVFVPMNAVGSYRGTISFNGDGGDTLAIDIKTQRRGHVTGLLRQLGNGLSFDVVGDFDTATTFTLSFSGPAGGGTAWGTISADGSRMTGTFTSRAAGHKFTGSFNVKRVAKAGGDAANMAHILSVDVS